jgi:uncharacterized protein (TIGR00369 family)
MSDPVSAVVDQALSTVASDVVLKSEPHACFGCGELNTSGLQLQLHVVPGGCWTELVVPERFQGWEGVVHGGVLSTILDEVMSWSLIERDSWGVTARLAVDFKRPVLVGMRIRAEGRVVEDRRRLVATAGRILDADTGMELVTAEAKFVTVTEARKNELQERYGNLAQARRDGAHETARAEGIGEGS